MTNEVPEDMQPDLPKEILPESEPVQAPENDSQEEPAPDEVTEPTETETPPTEEDSVSETPSEKEDVKVVNPHFVILFPGDENDAAKILQDRQDKLGSSDVQLAESRTQGSYDNVLLLSTIPGREATAAQARIAEAMKNGNFNTRLLDEKTGKTLLGVMLPPSTPAGEEGKSLEGKSAVHAFRRRRGGRGSVQRIPLYNSGIFIDLNGPPASMINNFIDAAREDASTIGRQFGPLFYTHLDHYAKRAAARLMRPLITGASLKNWERPGVLMNNIKLMDYDVILSAIAAMMFPEGFDGFVHACTNSKHCDHVTTANISIPKLVRHDYTKMTPTTISHMRRALSEDMTQADLLKYQAEIAINDGMPLRFGRYGILLKSPSYGEYLEAGERYLEQLNRTIINQSKEAVYTAISLQMLRNLAPWVKELYMYVDEISEVIDVKTSDQAAIEELLDDIQTDDVTDEFSAKMMQTIERAKISHVGYPAFACEACGHTPETTSGFLTVDPLEAFFTMCVRKLSLRA